MSRTRILIINNRVPYPLHDGGNIAVNEMLKTYRQAGMDVYLLAMNTSRHYVATNTLKALFPSVYAFETVDIDNSIKAVPLLKNLLFSSRPNHADRFFHAAFKDKLISVINNFKPDIIQVESIYLTEYIPFIRTQTKARLVLRLHNIEYQVWSRQVAATGSVMKRWYLGNLAARLKVYEYNAWKQYDLLLPITENDAEEVRNSGVTSDILTTPVGIDFDSIPQQPPNGKWTGYHIGAMDWEPNAAGILWFLEHVWKQVHGEFPDFEFHFAGRNMPEKFKHLNYENVICAGEVPDAEEFIRDKKILFVPIHAGGGIRVKVLEAMARGKVVVSTLVGMQGIDAVPGTHYLSANTAAEWIEAIRWVLTHTAEAEKMGQKALELVRAVYDKPFIDGMLVNKLLSIVGAQTAE